MPGEINNFKSKIAVNLVKSDAFINIQPVAATRVQLQPDVLVKKETVADASPVLQLLTVSPAFFIRATTPPQRSGPVMPGDNPAFFNDRFNANIKWYLPEFVLVPPEQQGFNFECSVSGPVIDDKPDYIGKATFGLLKKDPDAITTLKATPGIEYKEIPLLNITASFTINRGNKPSLVYAAIVAATDAAFTLTILFNDPSVPALSNFYYAVANPDNKPFCSLTINASYFSYTLKPAARHLIFVKQAMMERRINTLQSVQSGSPAVKMRMASRMIERPQDNIRPQVIFNVNRQTDDAAEYTINETTLYNKTFAQTCYDSASFPNNYILTKDGQLVKAFGSKPPFGDPSANSIVYTPININLPAELGINNVYLNTFTNSYLVIPQQYKLAIENGDEGMLIPSAKLLTVADTNDPKNSLATFKFKIVPDISAYQLMEFKKIILKTILPNSKKTYEDIFVEFPLHEQMQADKIVFDNSLIPGVNIVQQGPYTNGLAESKIIAIEFQKVPIGNGHAATIAERLKIPGGGFTEDITFTIDSTHNTNPKSSIALSLWDITGNGLLVHKSKDNLNCSFCNQTLYTIEADKFTNQLTEVKSFEPVLKIGPNEELAGNLQTETDEIHAAAYHYQYKADEAYIKTIVKEIRLVNVTDDITDGVIVTTNAGLFELKGIDHIDFELSIVSPNDPGKDLFRQSWQIIKDGVVNPFTFNMPVGAYLSERITFYSTVITFKDPEKPKQVNEIVGPINLNDIGKIINLTISKLNL